MKRFFFLALTGTALLVLIRPATAQTSPPPVRLILSRRSLGKAAEVKERANVLRPNVEQELFTYVQNDSKQVQTITVQLLAGGVEVAAVKNHPIAPGKFEQLLWPQTPPTPATRSPAELGNDKELTRPVVLRLLDAKGTPLGEDKTLRVDRPDIYLNAKYEFVPPRRGTETNRLIVTVTPNDNFQGPPCRVQLILDPARIPGLSAGQKKKGVYAGYVTGEKNDKGEFKSLYLVAEDIRLKDERRRSGIVTIQADGYNRAFAFLADFPLSGTPSTPVSRGKETLRLNLPLFADPRKPVPVVIEADNLEKREDARLVLEAAAPLPADKKGEGTEPFNLLAEFRGERDVHWLFRGVGTSGGLRFVPEVKDWSKDLDLSGLYGPVTLRLRLVDKEGKERKVLDADSGEEVSEVRKTLVLDDTPPEGLRIETSARAVRGKPFLVEARGTDEESGIREVVFFLGRPQPDGKAPPQAVVVPGKPANKGSKRWEAELIVPGDQRPPLEISARFTNHVGLSTTETVTMLQVTDPPPPAPPAAVVKKGSIAGVVMEGDRPQEGLSVDLLDPAGKVLVSTRTAKGGTFVFRDLGPGEYRVSSIKVASNTRGVSLPIPLAPGQDKVGVVVKLWRQ